MIAHLRSVPGPAGAPHRARTLSFGAEVNEPADAGATPVADPARCFDGFSADPARCFDRFSGGRYCPMVAVDIAAFSRRGEDVRRVLRTAMYDVLTGAFADSGLRWMACHHEDRGDGVLVVAPPGSPTAALIDPLVEHVRAGIRRHNKMCSDLAKLDLRMSVHVGQVHFDQNGVSGTAVNHLFRMLDAAAFKRVLSASGCHFALVASQALYEDVISQAPGLVDPAMYTPVSLHCKETRTRAWIYLPPVPNPFLDKLTSQGNAPRPAEIKRNRGSALMKSAAWMTKRQAATCEDDSHQAATPRPRSPASADAASPAATFTSAATPGDPPPRDGVSACARLMANAVRSRWLTTVPATTVPARVRDRLHPGQRVRQF